MATTERTLARGSRRGLRALQQLGEEFREARISAGLSQAVVGAAAGSSAPQLSRVERGTLLTLSVLDASRVASVLGLDLSVRVYPGGSPLRDAAHADRLMRLLEHVKPPLSYRLEVPLPTMADRPEQRAWDAVIRSESGRTAIELEMRLHDTQALQRRLNLKRRDDPSETFILLVADTRTNRRVLAEQPDLFIDLPRLRPRQVMVALNAAQLLPSGVLLV